MPGPLWHDFETACRGPREFDLAPLVLWEDETARLALAAYGDHDADVLEQCVPVYAAWISASWMVALPERPEEAPELAERLRWLRLHVRLWLRLSGLSLSRCVHVASAARTAKNSA